MGLKIISSTHTTTKGFASGDDTTVVNVCAFDDSIHLSFITGKQETRIGISIEESRKIGWLLIEAADAAQNASEKESV